MSMAFNAELKEVSQITQFNSFVLQMRKPTWGRKCGLPKVTEKQSLDDLIPVQRCFSKKALIEPVKEPRLDLWKCTGFPSGRPVGHSTSKCHWAPSTNARSWGCSGDYEFCGVSPLGIMNLK